MKGNLTKVGHDDRQTMFTTEYAGVTSRKYSYYT